MPKRHGTSRRRRESAYLLHPPDRAEESYATGTVYAQPVRCSLFLHVLEPATETTWGTILRP